MRLPAPVAATLLLAGCLFGPTYYDSARWTDAGLREAVQASPQLEGLVEEGPYGLTVHIGEVEIRVGDAGECVLTRSGAQSWSDERLRAEVLAFYDLLGRPPPTNVTFGHMHGD